MFVVALVRGEGIEFVGAAAVTLTFTHAQVADRLAEAERNKSSLYGADSAINEHSVHCHAWLTRYLVTKEILWCVYFVVLGAWSALVGVAVFLAYPLWRKWWRS